jgi:catechol 2,3-dioxygenase-like lactoylglutathione lyase family enzyme
MLCEKVSSPQAPLFPRLSRSIYRSSSWQAMRAVVSGELLLVGSIPLDTPEDVFRTFGPPLGKYLFAMPDGEVGPRRHWISRVHYQVPAAHSELEVVQHPAPDDNGVERQHPRNAADAWWFKVRDGVDRVRLGDPGWRLGYARDAVNSYFVFCTMKEKGVLPSHLRFQVSIPMVNSVLPPRIFPNQKDIDKVRPGYEAATRAEIAKIVEKIPAGELAIQWDCSTEIQDSYGAIAGYPLEGAIERNLIEVRNLSPHIPRDAALGYHFCFGTLGGWPRFAPGDLGQAVKLANAFVAASGRPVDWIHIPVLDRSDDSFYAPLQELQPQGARVYLGAIHNMPRFEERLATARKYLSDFGFGAYCGFGRQSASELPDILNDHLRAVEIAARASKREPAT